MEQIQFHYLFYWRHLGLDFEIKASEQSFNAISDQYWFHWTLVLRSVKSQKINRYLIFGSVAASVNLQFINATNSILFQLNLVSSFSF